MKYILITYTVYCINIKLNNLLLRHLEVQYRTHVSPALIPNLIKVIKSPHYKQPHSNQF